jgi:ceramide glucosyltransferase
MVAISLLYLALGIGCSLSLLMWFSQRRGLAQPLPRPIAYPGVSVLKPLKGVDPDLAANLETFYRQTYPSYEVVFGVRDADDPALAVARSVARAHPQVRTRIVVDDRCVGHNPKVNNLANMARWASHDLILISDSNVAAAPDYLEVMVAHIQAPGVGLVTSFIRGASGSGVGGTLEAYQLNTFVMGGIAAATAVFGRVCVVGKSMLLRQSVLEEIGGFPLLGSYLAEDQVGGEEIAALGHQVVVSPQPVDNVLGELRIRDFVSRHLRWARIRRRISPSGYLSELLTDPLPPAVVAAAVEPGVVTAGVLGGVLALLSVLSASAERRLGVRRPPIVYPLLVMLRSALVTALWPVPLFSRKVEWRGVRYRIGSRTRLMPLSDVHETVPWSTSDDLEPEESPAHA